MHAKGVEPPTSSPPQQTRKLQDLIGDLCYNCFVCNTSQALGLLELKKNFCQKQKPCKNYCLSEY